jgi:hypothetical protein
MGILCDFWWDFTGLGFKKMLWERKLAQVWLDTCLSLSLCIYIYIYIYNETNTCSARTSASDASVWLRSVWAPSMNFIRLVYANRYVHLLAGGLEHVLFSPIVGMMIQSDFHIFPGGLKPRTSLCSY